MTDALALSALALAAVLWALSTGVFVRFVSHAIDQARAGGRLR